MARMAPSAKARLQQSVETQR